MTLADAEMILDGWRDNPPAHHMMQILAMAWGWKPKRRPAPRPAQSVPAEILMMPGMKSGDVHQGLGAPVLDFESLKRQAGARGVR